MFVWRVCVYAGRHAGCGLSTGLRATHGCRRGGAVAAAAAAAVVAVLLSCIEIDCCRLVNDSGINQGVLQLQLHPTGIHALSSVFGFGTVLADGGI